MRVKKTIQGLCLIGAAVSLFGCGSGTGTGKPGPTQDDTPSSHSARILGKEQVQAVLPDLQDVPPGWEKSGASRLHGAAQDEGTLASGKQAYSATDLEGVVGFGIQSFQTRAQAIQGYTEKKSQMADAQIGPAQIPEIDAAFTASYCIGKNYCSTSINLRLDSVYAYVNINTDGPAAADAKILNSVTRMFVQRIRQAQRGQSPSAKAA
ncbi:hypothetical protein ACIHCV_45430 [Streptomyces sp. NPDC051956]|uniref:hypothetical protein n=1 Tax=Streptomyces sp. NPDC051956 TaxID=3365677 RepID=UPI0037D86367